MQKTEDSAPEDDAALRMVPNGRRPANATLAITHGPATRTGVQDVSLTSGRASLITSAGGHLAVVVLFVLSFAANPLNAPPPQPISVDIVSPSEAPDEPKAAAEDTTEPAKEAALPGSEAKAGSSDLTRPTDAPAKDGLRDDVAKTAKSPAKEAPAKEKDKSAAKEKPAEKEKTVSPRPTPDVAKPAPPAQQQAFVPMIIEEPGVTAPLYMPGLLPDSASDGSVPPPSDSTAKLPAEAVAAFRQRVKQCWKAPAVAASAQNVKITLRLLLQPDGTLSADPEMLEAPASASGPPLARSFIDAIATCQPYAMLPKDKYNDWKVLDLSLTPGELTGS